jgi:peptidoglycan hydrolase CwlO-like protein
MSTAMEKENLEELEEVEAVATIEDEQPSTETTNTADEVEQEPLADSVEAVEKKPNAFTRWLKSGETIKELEATIDTLENAILEREELFEALNAKCQETENALNEATSEIEKMANQIKELDTVEETVAALGFEPADLPAVETAEEHMSRAELWEVYNELPLEQKNEFYQKHRAIMSTSGIN